MADIQKIAEEISSLTLLEARDLVKVLEEKLGVKAAAPMAVAAMPVAGVGTGAEAAPAEEKVEFDVILTGFGDKKIESIQEFLWRNIFRWRKNLGEEQCVIQTFLPDFVRYVT